jgi:hypothetical protein
MAKIGRAAAVALLLGASVGAARAQQTVITSKSPYWKVGVADEALSKACATGRFGLKNPKRYIARFIGPEGGGVLGIAKGTGLNLRDPGHLAKPNEDYFFHAHGSTSCAVYVGGRK